MIVQGDPAVPNNKYSPEMSWAPSSSAVNVNLVWYEGILKPILVMKGFRSGSLKGPSFIWYTCLLTPDGVLRIYKEMNDKVKIFIATKLTKYILAAPIEAYNTHQIYKCLSLLGVQLNSLPHNMGGELQ